MHTHKGHSSNRREVRNLYQFRARSQWDHTWLLHRTKVRVRTPLGCRLALGPVCLIPRHFLSVRLQRILCLIVQVRKCSWLSLPSKLFSVSCSFSDRGSCLSGLGRQRLLLVPCQPRSLRSALRGLECTDSSSAGPIFDFGTTAGICCQRRFSKTVCLRFHPSSTALLLISSTGCTDFSQLL